MNSVIQNQMADATATMIAKGEAPQPDKPATDRRTVTSPQNGAAHKETD